MVLGSIVKVYVFVKYPPDHAKATFSCTAAFDEGLSEGS